MAIGALSRTGTGAYWLYWESAMAAFSSLGVLPTRAATLPTMEGSDSAVARDRRISCSGTSPARIVPLRSTISPRVAGTLTTLT